MNLSAIANAAITAVNPNLIGTVQVSTGYTTNADFTRTPKYQTFQNVPLQVQAMSSGDLRQVEGLNLQGNVRAIYITGAVEGLERVAMKGGDVITFNGKSWLVKATLEPWDAGGWCKVAAVEQSPPATM